MAQTEQIEIPLSNKNILLLLFGAVTFVVIGVLFLISPSPSMFIIIAGLVAISVFGLFAIVAFRKLFDKKVGLIINREGIIDNSSGVSAGLVLWSDIKEIKISNVASQKFLTFIVNNPQYYIDKFTNPLKRKAVEMNYRIYGSPINIAADLLQTNFESLHNLLTEKMKEYETVKNDVLQQVENSPNL